MESFIKESSVKTLRKFDKPLKCEVVRIWLASGKSAAVIAKQLVCKECPLFAWRKLLPPAAAGGKALTGGKQSVAADLQSELQAARREIQDLREQRDI